MRIKQLYIFLFFIWFGSTIIASATDKADSWTKEKESIVHEVISTFHNSLGFDYLTREECDSLNADGLLSQLDESQRYYTYFELERILIKSSLFRGEIRMDIAQSWRTGLVESFVANVYFKSKVDNKSNLKSMSKLGEIIHSIQED